MKKMILILLSFAIIAGCNNKSKNEKINIGVILPLTGDAAQYGKSIKNGIELAWDNSSNKEIINIIYNDDRGIPKEGINSINYLLANENVDIIIGGAMSSVAAAIAPISRQNKVVLLSPTATTPELSNAGEYFFRLWPSDTFEGKYLADVICNKEGLSKIAILYINTDYGKGITNVFSQSFNYLGGKIVYSEGYEQRTSDFKTQLLKLKKTNAQALYLPGYYGETASILKQMKELNIKMDIYGSTSFYDKKLIELAGELAEGIIFCYPQFDLSSNQHEFIEFKNQYRNKYNDDPDAFSVQGYDCFQLLEFIIVNNKNDKLDFKKKLSEIKDFRGINSVINFDVNGDVIKDLSLIVIKNGEFINYEHK